MVKKHRILSLLTAAACSIATMIGATLYTAAEEAVEVEKTVPAATYETEYDYAKTVSNEIGLSTTRVVTTIPEETTTTVTTSTTTIPIATMMTTSETQISLSGSYIHNETVTVGDGIPHLRSGEYSTSDESVVAINEYGNPVAVGVGTATVSVMQGSSSVELIHVTVTEPVAVTTSVTTFIDISTCTIINTTTAIVTSPTTANTQISIDDLTPILSKTVCVGDIVEDNDDYIYSTDNEEVVAINEDGFPVAVGVGTARVTGYIAHVIYFHIDVTVSPPVGDISGDGDINLYDAVEIAKSLMGMRTFTEDELLTADFNGDGEVNLYDIIEIAKLIME